MTYYATLAGDLAYGRNNEMSLFTRAVLRAMAGAGSDDPGDEWWVSTIQLHAAVSHFMKEPVFAGRLTGVQVPAVKDMPAFDLHQLPSPPVVPVYVGCVPDVRGNDTAEFVCRLDGAEYAKRSAADADDKDPEGRWLLDLEFGRYEFEARLGPNDVRRLTGTSGRWSRSSA